MDMSAPQPASAAAHDRAGIERACIAAARDAVRLHRFHGLPLVIWREGQVVEISPDEFEAALDEREAKISSVVAIDDTSK